MEPFSGSISHQNPSWKNFVFFLVDYHHCWDTVGWLYKGETRALHLRPPNGKHLFQVALDLALVSTPPESLLLLFNLSLWCFVDLWWSTNLIVPLFASDTGSPTSTFPPNEILDIFLISRSPCCGEMDRRKFINYFSSYIGESRKDKYIYRKESICGGLSGCYDVTTSAQ